MSNPIRDLIRLYKRVGDWTIIVCLLVVDLLVLIGWGVAMYFKCGGC